jgi:large subunit ribosomal protein L25
MAGFELTASLRERTGKGAARALRRTDMIPAVIYGNNEPAVAIAVPLKPVSMALYGGGFKTHLWTIDVGGQKIQALAKDYQREPVRDRLMHVDFLRVTSRSRVSVAVPVHFVDEDKAPGLRNDGGVLNVVHHTIEVEAPATRIPERFEVSLAGLAIGDSVTAAALALPEGVTLAETDALLATVAPPMAEEPEGVPEAPEQVEVPATEVAPDE